LERASPEQPSLLSIKMSTKPGQSHDKKYTPTVAKVGTARFFNR